MSPRLDVPRTPYAPSACPQGLTESHTDALDGLEGGLPEIPPYTEVGALDARACRRRSSPGWRPWKRARRSTPTYATRSSS